MNTQNILTVFAIIAGVVAVFELLEYVFTKNIPWLAQLGRHGWRWARRRLGLARVPTDKRYLVLNFSAHPVLPQQQQVIQAQMGWPKVEVIDAGSGNMPEDKDFVAKTLEHVAGIDLLPDEWQRVPFVAVPAGYAPAWSVLLAELHGRLGYFPDLVRLRPASGQCAEKYEVAEILPLREIRNQARAKR